MLEENLINFHFKLNWALTIRLEQIKIYVNIIKRYVKYLQMHTQNI